MTEAENFELNEFYMGEEALDTCIQVLKILEQDERGAYVVCERWNLGYVGRPWRISDTQATIFIPRHAFFRWAKLDIEDMTTPRTSSGRP